MIKRFVLMCMLVLPQMEGGGIRGYLGPHLHYTSFKFDGTDRLDGYLAGVSTGLEYCDLCYTASLDFKGSWDTNYMRGDPAQKSGVEEYFLEGRVGLKEYYVCQGIAISPYSGFGWHRFINDQFPHSISFCYKYDKLFVPLGIKVSRHLCEAIQASFRFEWRPDVYSRLRMHSTRFKTEKEHAFRIDLPLTFITCMPCGEIVWTLNPFYDWTRFGKCKKKSEVGAQLKVPRARRWETGLSCVIEYMF